MARRKKMSGTVPEDDVKKDDVEKGEDPTLPNSGESELLAALDQHEAEIRGEANPPPSVAPPPKKKKPPKPEFNKDDGRPKVALRIFIASGGIRWDQMAGFKSYALRNKMGPLSIPEWREAFNEFMKREV